MRGLGSDPSEFSRPLFLAASPLPIRSCYSTICASYRPPTLNLPSLYITPLESHPCANPERNSHGITSLRKKRGGGGCRAHFSCQTPATAEPINRLGADRRRFHRRGLHGSGLDEAAAAAFGSERYDNAQYHDGEDFKPGQRPAIADAIAQ